METFTLIMIYSFMVLVGLSVAGGVLVALAIWLIDNSGDEHAH